MRSKYFSSRAIARRFATLFLLLCIPAALFAQDNVGEETTIMYPASYFTEFNPVTVQDMLDRIPGVGSATGGSNQNSRGPGQGGGNGGRGLGSGSGGSQVLINGKRTAGKNNQASGQMDRITADQVNYIEIIRGTSGELDVRGSGQIVNVVLFEDLSANSLSYEVNMDRYLDHNTQPGGSVSYSGQTGGLNYVLSAVAEPRYDHNVSKETSILADFALNDEVREERIREQTSYDFSVNLDYELSLKSSVRFNALYSENDNPTDVLRYTTDLRATPRATAIEREEIPGDRNNWEIGGDYEYLSEGGNRFKVLFISNRNNSASTRERYDVFADGSESKDLFLDLGSVTTERIVRGSYTMGLFEGQDIEFGAERAQTTLDSSLALGLPSSAGTPSADFGGLVPQAVSNANSTVEEIRIEPFIIHNWIINSRMTLESTLLYELSEISQSGDVNRTRDFDFVKPKVDFRYNLTPQLQLRGSAEKVVRQLRFSDFVASNDPQDNDSITLYGNENLRQEWFWKYDFYADYRLPNDIGVVNMNLFYHQHKDRIARIDVSPSEDNLQSANGNIGDGDVVGISINSSIRMRMINLPNLLVTSALSVRDSEIEDPFLGIDRRFARFGRGRLTLGFRHDLPRWNMNYGLEWSNRFDSNEKVYDIDDIADYIGEPNTNAFVQFVDSRGTTYRFDARNATSNLQCRERTRFVGRISANILEEIEDRCETSGRVVSLKINGTF
ncbi:MAG: TonB-dependent receptor [Gammaproteobacteria bacterium]|jgi:outer membrane receptor for ferrienterochelin and colicins|nr:TonB-dependent receptor [Gammaproteobacteria bacterium]